MSKITSFDRATCRLVSDKIAAALAPLAAELGIAIKPAGGSYGSGYYTLKLDIATVSPDGETNSRDATAFKQLATAYGLKADDLGKEFRSGGRTFKVVGLRPRASARPIIGESNGKQFCFAAEDVKRALEVK